MTINDDIDLFDVDQVNEQDHFYENETWLDQVCSMLEDTEDVGDKFVLKQSNHHLF